MKTGWLTRWRDAVRSHLLALRASRRYGRVIKLRRSGHPREALDTARDGLLLLGRPEVLRQQGPEAAALVCLTIEVEQLAQELGERGVSPRELEGAVEFLRSLPQDSSGTVGELRRAWLPYLETRLANLSGAE